LKGGRTATPPFLCLVRCARWSCIPVTSRAERISMKNLFLLLLLLAVAIFALGITQAKEWPLILDQDAVTATLDDVDIGTTNAETPNTFIVTNGDSDDTMTGQTTTAPAIATRSSLLNLIDELDQSYYGLCKYQALARGGVAAACRYRSAGSAGIYSNCMFTINTDAGAVLS